MTATPDMVVIHLLRSDPDISAATGGRISTDLQKGDPAVRVQLIGGGDPLTVWEWNGTVQVDVWAQDQLTAADVVALIRSRWTNYRGRTIDHLGAYVSGTWLESSPVFLLDPDSGSPRYMLTLGVAVHEAD